jgi:hypothetical protein
MRLSGGYETSCWQLHVSDQPPLCNCAECCCGVCGVVMQGGVVMLECSAAVWMCWT